MQKSIKWDLLLFFEYIAVIRGFNSTRRNAKVKRRMIRFFLHTAVPRLVALLHREFPVILCVLVEQVRKKMKTISQSTGELKKDR